MSLDPLFFKFDGYSPYNFALNNPIPYKDADGKDVWVTISATTLEYCGHAQIIVTNYKKVNYLIDGKVTECYVKDGYKTYQLAPTRTTPNGVTVGGNSATKSEGEPALSTFDNEGIIQVNDITVEPQKIGTKIEYFTKDQIQTDLNVSEKAQKMVDRNQPYSILTNNCTDFVTQALGALDPKYNNIAKETIVVPFTLGLITKTLSTPNMLATKLKADTTKTVVKYDEAAFQVKTQEYVNNLDSEDVRDYLDQ